MGMAASQARFLQLTTRKNNIEYMGQQINQARLALANASAGLFEKMLALEVPTPPSSQDEKYVTQGYVFTDSDGNDKKLNYGVLNTDTSGLTTSNVITIKYTDGGAKTLTIGGNTTTGNIYTLVGGETPVSTSTGTAEAVAKALGIVLEEGQQALLREVNIQYTTYNPDGDLETKIKSAPALLIFDELTRLIKLELLDKSDIDMTSDDDTKKPTTIDNLTFSSLFDEEAYDNDMNEYEFQKSSYDYQIERINQETKVIQQRDQSLELKMRQLDTEHNAIQTEMDAVQKVMQKNVESTFKIFS